MSTVGFEVSSYRIKERKRENPKLTSQNPQITAVAVTVSSPLLLCPKCIEQNHKNNTTHHITTQHDLLPFKGEAALCNVKEITHAFLLLLGDSEQQKVSDCNLIRRWLR